MKWYRWNPNTKIYNLSSHPISTIYANILYGNAPTKGTISSPYHGIRLSGEINFKKAYFLHTDGSEVYSSLGLTNGAYIGFPDEAPADFSPFPTPVEKANTKIKGRYEPKQNFPTALASDSTGSFTIDFSYKFNNELYNGVHLNIKQDGTITAYTPDKEIDNDILMNAVGPVSSFEYIDFGDSEQDIPLDIYNWIMDNFTLPKVTSLSVYPNDGSILLAQTPLIEDTETIALARIGNQITLTTNNNDSISWTATQPNKHFAGLTMIKDGVSVKIYSGKVNRIALRGEIKLYEVYGEAEEQPTEFAMHFYKNVAEYNRVDKSAYITSTITLSGTLREACSVMAPAFNIQVENIGDVLNSNYVYIPVFRRYYFVTDITSIYKDLWRVSCSCDVLMSFKDSIYQLEGIIARNEFDYNDYLEDSEIVTEVGVEREFIEIPSNAFSTTAAHDKCYAVTIWE